MAGLGARKATTDASLSLDIRAIMRAVNHSVGGKVLYRWNSERQDMPVATMLTMTARNLLSAKHIGGGLPNELFDLTHTGCNLGGQRTWFLCSRIGCGRRIAVIYDTPKGFRCRHCARLVYRSTREREYDRMLRRARRVRDRVGGSGNLLKDFPDRPKGMHQETYEHFLGKDNQIWDEVGKRKRVMRQSM